jgi:hypothetical protein
MNQTEANASQRTGILTLHYGYNEGAILQAYALSELLNSQLTGSVEIVDQRYPSKVAAYKAANGDTGPNARKPANARIRALANAIEDWLPLSRDRYQCTNSTRLIRDLGDRYDRLVFGSDVLWRLRYRESRVPFFGTRLKQDHPFFPAFPNVYWPSVKQACSKVVFSASIGSFDWRIVPPAHVQMMRVGLESCCAIGVRDEWTMEFVSQLSTELADRVCMLADPTFARPFRERARLKQADQALKESLSEMGVDFSRPRCLIIARAGGAACAAVEFLERRGWQTVAVTELNDRCSLRLYDRSFHPLEWARLFGCFDACVTERMHGAIFSLLNNTPLLPIEMTNAAGNGLTKMQSFLRRFDLEDVLLQNNEEDPVAVQQAFEQVIDKSWDWDRINEQIEEASDQQIEFLQDSISGDAGGWEVRRQVRKDAA